jgi:ATP adenylyltransferase
MEYVATADTGDDCFLCTSLADDDDAANHILYRGSLVFVILNAFPYNSGHVMVAPNRHVGELSEMTVEERGEMMEVTTSAVGVLGEGLGAHGYNIGLNLGRVAGAGLPGHLHVHVVPRWGGDTNFMPVVGETKVLPEMIAETDAKLRPLFERPPG